MNDQLPNINNPKYNVNSFVFAIYEFLEEEITPGAPTSLRIKIEGKINGVNMYCEAREELRFIEEMKNNNYSWKEIKIKEMLFTIIDDELKNKVIKI